MTDERSQRDTDDQERASAWPDVPSDPAALLERVYALIAAGKSGDATTLVFFFVDDAMGHYLDDAGREVARVGRMIELIDWSRLDAAVSFGIVASTFPLRGSLAVPRELAINKMRERLLELGHEPARVERLILAQRGARSQ